MARDSGVVLSRRLADTECLVALLLRSDALIRTWVAAELVVEPGCCQAEGREKSPASRVALTQGTTKLEAQDAGMYSTGGVEDRPESNGLGGCATLSSMNLFWRRSHTSGKLAYRPWLRPSRAEP